MNDMCLLAVRTLTVDKVRKDLRLVSSIEGSDGTLARMQPKLRLGAGDTKAPFHVMSY